MNHHNVRGQSKFTLTPAVLDLDPGDNPLLDYQYTYDKTGNIEQRATQDKTYDYDYDLLQRLTEAKSEDETEGWTYDPNGNRISDSLNPGTWDYDENDRMLESPGVTYGYDQAGNMTSKTKGGTTTTYLYNAEGRLSRIEDSSSTMIAEYAYDPLGRRYKKVTQSRTLYFHYTEEGIVGEFDVTGIPVRLYGYAPDSDWMKDPLYMKTSLKYGYYHNDHLGTPQQVVGKNGAKLWEGIYLTFGEIMVERGGEDQRIRFPGQYFDEESGNYYNYYRFYDPSSGRYIKRDPIGLKGSLNTYVYVSSNPLKYIDIKGLIIYLCTRTVTIGPGIGNHAYIWDSRTHQCCGRNKGFDPLKSCSEKGPGPNGDSCVVVPGSGGKEGKIMNCCHKSGNDGPWVPPFSDCHTSAKKCIEEAGLKYPGAPGGRGGSCDSCWTKPYDDPSTGP